jgi:hypothetical protein
METPASSAIFCAVGAYIPEFISTIIASIISLRLRSLRLSLPSAPSVKAFSSNKLLFCHILAIYI